MAKADYYFTFHLLGDDDNIQETSVNDLQEMLEGMIDDLIGSCEEFYYEAELTNKLTGDTVKKELTNLKEC